MLFTNWCISLDFTSLVKDWRKKRKKKKFRKKNPSYSFYVNGEALWFKNEISIIIYDKIEIN